VISRGETFKTNNETVNKAFCYNNRLISLQNLTSSTCRLNTRKTGYSLLQRLCKYVVLQLTK